MSLLKHGNTQHLSTMSMFFLRQQCLRFSLRQPWLHKWISALVTSDALWKLIKLSACQKIVPGISYLMKSAKIKLKHLFPQICRGSSGCDFIQSIKLNSLTEMSWKFKLIGAWMLLDGFHIQYRDIVPKFKICLVIFCLHWIIWPLQNFSDFGKQQQWAHLHVGAKPCCKKALSINMVLFLWCWQITLLSEWIKAITVTEDSTFMRK